MHKKVKCGSIEIISPDKNIVSMTETILEQHSKILDMNAKLLDFLAAPPMLCEAKEE